MPRRPETARAVGRHLGGEQPQPRAHPGRGPADRTGARDARVTVKIAAAIPDAPGISSSTVTETPDRRISSSAARSAAQARDRPLRVAGERQRPQISSRSSADRNARMALPLEVACSGRRSPTPPA